MTMHCRWDGKNQVYYEGHRMRVVDVIGPGVEAKVNLGDAIQDTDPQGWVSTVVEVGAGTTELSGSATAGIVARLTNAANENDGGSYQAPGQVFVCIAGQKWYAGLDFTSSEESEIGIFFGISVTDTALLGATSDGTYMETLDAGTGISCVNEVGAAETQADDLGTMAAATRMYWEMFWDGDSVHFFIDGTEVLDTGTGVNGASAMRLSLEFLNGEAVAHTLDIHSCRAFSWVP